MINTFGSLHKRFLKLRETTGASKISSFSMSVYFSAEEMISIELGGYDIADWNRHEHIGDFYSEEEALIALENKIKEAEEIVKNGNYDD